MTDIIIKHHNSVIQHGPDSDRVYLIRPDVLKINETLDFIESLIEQHGYSKIFAKVPVKFHEVFTGLGYAQEAEMPNFIFLAKYPFPEKERHVLKNKDKIDHIINICRQKRKTKPKNRKNFNFIKLTPDDVPKLAELYKKVFKTYPFPIFSEDYLLKTMAENVAYFGIKHNDRLIAASSAEMYPKSLNAEMTDFAALPDYRGNNLAYFLLQQMENYIKGQDFEVSYTIARAVSTGMNVTFARNGYTYGGTLVNNTNISGDVESMNVWWKRLG